MKCNMETINKGAELDGKLDVEQTFLKDVIETNESG